MFARTPRLLLRPGWIEDAPALAEAIGDHSVIKNLATPPWPYRLSDAEAYLAGRTSRVGSDMLIFARTRGTPKLVGGIGLSPADGGALELGYWIARPYWGLGFATEAGQAVVETADEGLRIPRLVSGHFVDNPASGRVLRKLGFVPTGSMEMRYCKSRNRIVPCVAYARETRADRVRHAGAVAAQRDPAMAA